MRPNKSDAFFRYKDRISRNSLFRSAAEVFGAHIPVIVKCQFHNTACRCAVGIVNGKNKRIAVIGDRDARIL